MSVLTEGQREQIVIMRKEYPYTYVKRFFNNTYGITLTGWDIRRICKEAAEEYQRKRTLEKGVNTGFCSNCLHFKTRIFTRKGDIDNFLKINNFIIRFNRLYKKFTKKGEVRIYFCEFFKTKHQFYISSQLIDNMRVSSCSLYKNMDE